MYTKADDTRNSSPLNLGAARTLKANNYAPFHLLSFAQ
jgi:hypothetical protein